MVSIVQSDSNEDSQGRQLSMNKRLPKVVSAAPRARFQKARPKVPSIKREPGSTPVQTKPQPLTVTDRSETKKEIFTINGEAESNSVSSDSKEFVPSTDLCVSQNLLSEDQHFKCDIPEIKIIENEPYENDSADVVFVEDKCVFSKKEDATSSVENKEIENSTASLADQNGHLVSYSSKSSESCSSPNTYCEDLNEVASSSSSLSGNGTTSEVCEREIFKLKAGESPNKDECISSNSTNLINGAVRSPARNEKGTEVSASKQNASSVSSSEVIKSLSTGKKETEISISLQDASSVSFAEAVSTSYKKGTEISANTQNVSPASSSTTQSTPDTNSKDTNNSEELEETCEAIQRFISNNPTEEKNDISPTTTEKSSSKYPHLTSILSKKRIEPKRDNQHKKRKRYKKGDTAPERSKMTMEDLIYWNPTSEDAGLKKVSNVDETPVILNDVEPEECPDEDDPVEEEAPSGPVPRLIISEDGEINIDQGSLVIQRKTLPVQNVIEKNEDTTYSSFRKRPLSKHWTTKETTIFYKALSLVGTDFGLMEKLLPERTRRELKLKFKREEKYNIDLVNKAMYDSMLTFDENTLEEHIQLLNAEILEETQESDQSSLKENKKSKAAGKRRGKKDTNGTELKDKEVNDKNNEVNDKNEAGNENVICNKRGRKKKQPPSVFTTTDKNNVEEGSDIQSTIDASGEKMKVKNKVINKKAHSKKEKSIVDEMSDKNGSSNGNDIKCRKRKKKKLPEDFISLDDVEDITELTTGEKIINDIVCSPKKSHKSGRNLHKSPQKLPKAKLISDKTCNETTPDNVEIVYLEELTKVDPDFNQEGGVVIAEGSSLTVPQIVNDSVESGSSAQTLPYSNDNQETECITVNIIQNYDPLNVMSNEVVISKSPSPKPKRKRNVENTLKRIKKEKPQIGCKQSSFATYTPAEESLLSREKNVHFSPEHNLKTYSKIQTTPHSANALISSLQSPSLTPIQSSSLLTSLNMSNHQPIAIPLTPQGNASPSPVMFMAKSPNTDNIIHLFMYKSPSS